MTADPSAPHIGLVVEGPGDAKALPLLLRRHLEAQGVFTDPLGKPLSCNGRDKALVPGGIERFVATAASRPGCRAVLVVLDSEGDLICELGPALLERARAVSRLPVRIALAEKDFEDWLCASAETLKINIGAFDPTKGGQAQIKAALAPAKYVKPTWQPRLAARVDLGRARARSNSLDRMLNRFDELMGELA